jgi:hypothetical protein
MQAESEEIKPHLGVGFWLAGVSSACLSPPWAKPSAIPSVGVLRVPCSAYGWALRKAGCCASVDARLERGCAQVSWAACWGT